MSACAPSRSARKSPSSAAPSRAAATDPGEAAIQRTKVFVGDGWREATIYARAKLQAGNRIPGPAIVVEMDSTTLILPDCAGVVDDYGNILIRPNG